MVNYYGKEVTVEVLEELKSAIFWDITSCSPLRINRLHLQGRKNKLSKKPACHLLSHRSFAQLIFSALNMEAVCSFETSDDIQRTTRRYIPEDGTRHNHRCEKLILLEELFRKSSQ
jgi:hypothetical protein